MNRLTRIFSIFLAVIMLTAAVSASTALAASKTLILATTTSTQDSGLLDVLVPMFEKQNGLLRQNHFRRQRTGDEDG